MPPQQAQDNPAEALLDSGLRAAFGPPESRMDDDPGGLEDASGTGRETRIELPEPGGEPYAATEGERYERRGEIGRGGMGIIVRMRDANLGREVAMKVLKPRHADNQAMVQRFVDEARIAGQLQHPGVLQVYELGLQADQRPFFTMKLIKGRTLADLLEAR
ncbi:MAG: protein kinase domain-containing protein, partial [Planctomycetota bacterium]